MLRKFFSRLRFAFTGDCGHVCETVQPYGFVPEADCPVHDRNIKKKEIPGFKEFNNELEMKKQAHAYIIHRYGSFNETSVWSLSTPSLLKLMTDFYYSQKSNKGMAQK